MSERRGFEPERNLIRQAVFHICGTKHRISLEFSGDGYLIFFFGNDIMHNLFLLKSISHISVVGCM